MHRVKYVPKYLQDQHESIRSQCIETNEPGNEKLQKTTVTPPNAKNNNMFIKLITFYNMVINSILPFFTIMYT